MTVGCVHGIGLRRPLSYNKIIIQTDAEMKWYDIIAVHKPALILSLRRKKFEY
jgi:hypothetical protein